MVLNPVGLGALTPNPIPTTNNMPVVPKSNPGEQSARNAYPEMCSYMPYTPDSQFRPIVNSTPLLRSYMVPPYMPGGTPNPYGVYPVPHNQGMGVGSHVEQQLQDIRSLLSKVPGLPHPMEVATPECYANSPFMDSIALVSMPKGFATPTMTLYDRTEDPLEHINQYKQKMIVVAATGLEKEACMCKGFGSTLSGAALQWFVNLSNKSISSFAGLVNVFNQQFASSRKPEKLSSDLYRIVQRFEESTRDYLARFDVEKISIPRCDPTTLVNAFRRGLHRDSDLYKDLTQQPCATFEEVKQMAEATYRLEEDEDRRDLYETESSSRKITTGKKNERTKPYSKNTVNKVSGETESTEAPSMLSEYGFTTGLARVLKAIRELGQRARWPKKPTPRENDRTKASKRCEYHNDIGHNTEDCVVLRKEVKHLYSARCLYHLLLKGAKSEKVNTADQAQPSPPPPYSKVVSVITRGSEICGLTYSAAKRHAIETKENKQEFSLRVSRQDLPEITFDEADIPDEAKHHYDALIITFSIGNCLVKKILVDTGSSVNLIMLETLKNIGFSEKDLVQKAVPLVGFSGETKKSLGEIVIPTFAGGMNKQVWYLVIDGPSTYNVILGRPWIHEMKAVTSTYHQSLKFPTPWGVQEIRGDQNIARDCYKNALKPTAAGPA
ncbi:uncharacterized protein LOC141632530 [Silene latifolia]|uniref:uncharacterized protein LOC141632530 n=1 Tax=Silene latifolia TaxID=37657 RepID=UPI003D771E7E